MDPLLVSNLLVGAASLTYAAASAAFFVHVLGPQGSPSSLRLARRAMWAALGLLMVFLGFHGAVFHICPVKTIGLGACVAAAAATALYLLSRRAMRVDALGVFVAPLALLLVLAGRVVGLPAVSPSVHTSLLPVHIACNLLGDAAFVVAAGASVLYLVQERHLKAKRAPSALARIPALHALDRTAHRASLVAFAFSTIGAVIGSFWVGRLSGDNPAEVVRIVLGYVAWAGLGVVVALRVVAGWQARRGAWGNIVGFAVAMVVLLLYLGKAGMVTR